MRFNLNAQLILSHLSMGIIPLLVISVVIWLTVAESFETIGDKGVSTVEHAAYEQLTTMCSIKEKQIAYLFRVMEGQMYMLRDNA
ncbi:MAG: hypothetical protein D3905_04670, partial [Candidatus Electrothrix sp. AS4_5]|nr:hypothetical protein [Candidatus Electrothrix gigas]